MTNPDQIERETTQRREALARDVARFNEKASPSSFLQRRKAKLQETTGSLKDNLMGPSGSPAGAAKDRAGSAVSSVQDATDALGEKVSGTLSTDGLARQTRGNPVAAGVIAFGVGWLLSSLAPVSDAEQKAAAKVEDAVGDPLKESAQEMAGNLQQPVQDSAQALRSTATDAAQATTEQARASASTVKDTAATHASEQANAQR